MATEEKKTENNRKSPKTSTHKHNDEYASIKLQINNIFDSLISQLNARRLDLILELNKISEQQKSVFEEKISSVKELELIQESLSKLSPKQNISTYIHDKHLKNIKEDMDNLKNSYIQPKMKFSCNTSNIEASITTLGAISFEVPCSDTINLSSIDNVLFGGSGDKTGLFMKPRGLAVDEARQLIFVADQGKQKLEGLDYYGNKLYAFSLAGPYGVDVSGDLVYVTDIHHNSVFCYSLSQHSLLARGGGSSIMTAPRGLAVNLKLNIVCVADYARHCVTLFNMKLAHQFSFGSGVELLRPEDVSIHDKLIYVLDHGADAIMHCYDLKGIKLRSITGDIVSKNLKDVWFFAIDKCGRIILSDVEKSSLFVFTLQGEFVQQIGREGEQKGEMKYPRGVCCAESGSIWVASSNKNFTVQSFIPELA